MARFIHVSDTHLCRTYPSVERVEAFNSSFRQVVDKAVEEEVDFILHSGDLFDKLHPWPNVVAFVKKQLKRLNDAGIGFFVVRGNHDGSYDSEGVVRGCSIDLLHFPGLSNLVLLDPLSREGMAKDFKGLKIAGLGYYGHETEKFFKNYVSRSLANDGSDVLLLHVFVDGYTTAPPGQPSIPLSYLESLKVKYVALGHEHNRHPPKLLSNGALVANPGSTEKFDFLEDEGKGFYVVDMDGEARARWVPVESEQSMKLIRVEASEPAKPQWFVEEAISKLHEVVEASEGRKLFVRIQMRGQVTEGLPSDIQLSKVHEELDKLKRAGRLAYGDVIPPDVEVGLQELKLSSEGVDVLSFFKSSLDSELAEKLYRFYTKVREVYADDDSLTKDGNIRKEARSELLKDLLEGW